MKVVIAGSRSRDESKDKELVHNIITDVTNKYSKLIIVSKSSERGVGRIISERCKSSSPNPEFDMMTFDLKHLLRHELPRPEFLNHFNLLNAPLVEIGDEFHILTEDFITGSIKDLIERVKQQCLPYALYKPSDPPIAKSPSQLG